MAVSQNHCDRVAMKDATSMEMKIAKDPDEST